MNDGEVSLGRGAAAERRGPAPLTAPNMSLQVPRPQSSRLRPVCPRACWGVVGASTAVLELAQARLGLPDSMSFMNQVPGSASGEADPRQMPPAGSQRRTRVEGGHSRGQVCPQ